MEISATVKPISKEELTKVFAVYKNKLKEGLTGLNGPCRIVLTSGK